MLKKIIKYILSFFIKPKKSALDEYLTANNNFETIMKCANDMGLTGLSIMDPKTFEIEMIILCPPQKAQEISARMEFEKDDNSSGGIVN